MAFIGKQISVQADESPLEPTAFEISGRVYEVVKILETYFDTGHGSIPASARSWRTRRHRRVFKVLTRTGETATLYYDYARKDDHVWVLTRLEPPKETGGAHDQ